MEDFVEDVELEEEEDELTFDENLQVVPNTKESQLVANTKKLVEDVLEVDDTEQLKRATALFNQNMAKKNMLRLLKVGNILDAATDEVMKRILNKPENISDKDLATFYTMLQKASSGYQDSINGIGENPVIQINNQTINVDKPQLSSESNQRVMDAINLLMKLSTNQTTPVAPKVDEVEVVEERNE